MNELLRFISGSSIGVSFILLVKKEFVFYEDIIDVSIMKTWQNNVFINVKPMGFNIYKVSDEICTRIKEIVNK